MLASSILLGVAIGLVTGGSWRSLGRLRIEWWPLAILAVALRLFGMVVPVPLPVHVVAIALVVVVAARNVRIPGAALIAVGSFLNAIVISANGGMPVDTSAAAAVGALPLPGDSLHISLGADTRLTWLADVVPVAIFRNVYSVGDFIIAVGGVVAPLVLLRRR